MVYIKKLELRGFKSFGNRLVTIHFDRGLIGVTGPNGSGKSNIIDAIMFSLGQTNPRNLRVNRLSSLIFDGSGGEKPRDAKATVTLENSDRLIHVDTDNVTISREIRSTGESTYLLNGKKIQKGTLREILSLAMIDPDGLNFVPQGMVTRLSELSAEEKRIIIEEIVGVAQFNEKSERAKKTLDESDRKLEVALARIDEIRSRIDSLEGERNDELRLRYLEKEIGWLNALLVSQRLLAVRNNIADQKDQIKATEAEKGTLEAEVSHLNDQIAHIEEERTKFLNSILEERGKELVDLQVKIAQKRNEIEKLKSQLGDTTTIVQKITDTLPYLSQMREDGMTKLEEVSASIASLEKDLVKRESEKRELDMKLQMWNDERNEVRRHMTLAEDNVRLLNEKINLFRKATNSASSSISEAAAKKTLLNERLKGFKEKAESIDETLKVESQIEELERTQSLETRSLSEIERTNSAMDVRRVRLEEEVSKAIDTLQTASDVVVKHESQIAAARELSRQQASFSRLKAITKERSLDGFLGRFEDLVTLDGEYQVPLLAAGRRWINAVVVKDMASLLRIVEPIKKLKLGRVALIPLSDVWDTRMVAPPNDPNIVGCLSDLLNPRSDLKGLVNFVFGDTLLVKTSTAAYLLSQKGFRTVTGNGDLFEAGGSALETGSIFPMANLIFDTSSHAAIKKGVSSLRQTIEKRKSDLTSLNSQAKVFESDKIKKSMAVEKLNLQISNLRSLYSRYERVRLALRDQSVRTAKELNRTTRNLNRRERSKEVLLSKIADKEQRINDSAYTKLNERGLGLDAERSDLLRALEQEILETTQVSTELTRKKADLEHNLQPQLRNLDNERRKGTEELDSKKRWLESAKRLLPQMETELFNLSQDEMKLDVESRKSKAVLEEFDNNTRKLRREKEAVSRSLSGLEKRIVSTSKGLESQADTERALSSKLSTHGYSTLLDTFEGVERIKDELDKEYETLRGDVNLLADKNYREIYVGYKGMSERKNQLEGERNAIVNFIESVEAEKKKAFLDAFEKIDRELREIFAKLTNGSAWLELEDPDDVFNSGVLLMAQFPNKIARESGVVSGGEKTVSALSLILAIQAVNPAPFYIFDEIDAHLDAVNSDRLAELLKERVDRSQIVIVSLKDAILSRADSMYGVYMEKGLSKTLKYQPRIEVQMRNG